MKRIMAIGDIVGKCGRNLIFKHLPGIRTEYKIDFVIANGENATTGNGINEKYAIGLLEAGVDVITLGNHAFGKKDLIPMLNSSEYIIRPLNLDPSLPGDGVTVIESGGFSVAVINILGLVYLAGEGVSDPFDISKRAVKNIRSRYGDICIFIDFHAEATSEKQALAYYLDGEITALFGTHTHVQTNDARVLPGGTGYMTDIGMTGPEDSIIGAKKDLALSRFLNEERKSFKWSEDAPMLNGAVFTIDETTGKALEVSPLKIYF